MIITKYEVLEKTESETLMGVYGFILVSAKLKNKISERLI